MIQKANAKILVFASMTQILHSRINSEDIISPVHGPIHPGMDGNHHRPLIVKAPQFLFLYPDKGIGSLIVHIPSLPLVPVTQHIFTLVPIVKERIVGGTYRCPF